MNIHWKTVWLTLATLAVAGVVAASAWIGFGLYNVSARLGHFPGMSWVFHTTYRNAVDLWSDETREVPDTLDDPAMIALGAKHFENACRVCHSAPGAIRSATSRAIVPEPPHIEEAVDHWTPIQLHWIVYEGVKMTGMPGWPAPREEEVWPVVAFLLAVQEGMEPERYEELTARQRARPQSLAVCRSCHGATGNSGNPNIPRLDILSERYIALSLEAYREGFRQSGIMQHAATSVPEELLESAASAFARVQPPADAEAEPLSGLARDGRELAFAGGTADNDVPACRACHGPWGEPLDPAFPSIAGQHEPYLEEQLRLWRNEARGGGPAAQLMHEAARGLSDAEIAALAAYYAALAPAKLDAVSDVEP